MDAEELDNDFFYSVQKPLKILPRWLRTGIGDVVYRCSFIEFRLRHVLLIASGINDRKIGEFIIRDPRLDEAFQLINDLLKIGGLELNFDAKFKTSLIDAKQLRDMLAHNVYSKTDGGEILVLTRIGKWDVGSYKQKWTRKLRPEWVKLRPSDFHEFIADLDLTIQQSYELETRVLSLLSTLPEIPRPPSPGRAETQDRNPSTPSAPQSPSPE